MYPNFRGLENKMIIDMQDSIIMNKTKIVVKNGDYVDVKFLINTSDQLKKLQHQPKYCWSRKDPQFVEANLIWEKVHPDLIVEQGWNEEKNVYTVRTNYIEPLLVDKKSWEKDAKLYLDLIDVMGFEKTKDDQAYWNVYHGLKDGEEVSYIIDWDELIQLGSEEKAYNFYKEELCRYQHSRVYFKDAQASMPEIEEMFDKLWKAKVG